MKYKICATVFFIFFITHLSARKEINVFIREGVSLNKNRVSLIEGEKQITKAKNTFMSSIGINFLHCWNSGILFSAGADLGIEKYRLDLDYPYEAYGFLAPEQSSGKYRVNLSIPYASGNFNFGYRFKILPKFSPEFRVGQIVQFPLKSKTYYDISEEKNADGNSTVNFKREAVFGKSNSELVLELVNSIYLGLHGPKSTAYERLSFGFQYQTQLFLKNNDMNFYKARYDDAAGFTKSVEEFKSYHNSISIIIGYKL